jgi:hypothetical protein
VVIASTNYTLLVAPCEFLNGTSASTIITNADFQGIGRIQFVRVSDGNYNYLTKQFYTPITNTYSMVLTRNGQAGTVTFQRVVTTPDFVFSAQDMEAGPSGIDYFRNSFGRNVIFNQANTVDTGLAGPGTIDSPSTITYNKVGPDFLNVNPGYLSGPDAAFGRWFIWGSFDGTTNAPIVYPNGTSIANLSAEALIQISPPPPTLPDGTNGVSYSVVLSATGGQSPYTWLMTTNSAGLPPNLTLSAGGVISGMPTNCIINTPYDNIEIQMNDSSGRSVTMVYSITIH